MLAMAAVTIVDETAIGERSAPWRMEVGDGTLTLRELIRRRILQGLGRADPADPDGLLHDGLGAGAARRVDAQDRVVRAWEAFSRNGFVVLVDDRQVEDLDAKIDLHDGTRVTFLKLVPLVGG